MKKAFAIKMGASYSQSELPRQFSNQVYFSEDTAFEGFSYQSPYSIKYVMSGFETYNVQGREVLIKPQEHLLVNSGSEVTTLKATGRALSLFIAPETMAGVKTFAEYGIQKSMDNFSCLKTNTLQLFENTYQHENTRVNKLLKQLVAYLNSIIPSEHHEMEIDQSLFFRLSEALIADQSQHSIRLTYLNALKPSTIQEQYRRLQIGYEYLNDNWNQPFSLKKVAAIATLSPYHFHRLFKACFTSTPYQYHLKIQMDKAVELLNNKHLSVSEIGFQLGYNSPTAFGRVFKKYFGLTPSQYRLLENKQYL